MVGGQAAQTVTVCAPQQISIPEGASPDELLHCDCRGCLVCLGDRSRRSVCERLPARIPSQASLSHSFTGNLGIAVMVYMFKENTK